MQKSTKCTIFALLLTGSNEDKTKMEPKQFIDNYNQVKELVKGHGPRIAESAGIKLSTYYNVIRGLTSDPSLLQKVWDAMREKSEEIVSNIPTNI